MSTGTTQEINEDSIIKIKKQIQEGIKSNNHINDELLNKISKYKVANQEELTRLSKAFGNVNPRQATNPGSGTS